ncbi:hypothetical protein ACFWAP_00635 [Streptomyces goshikiensis]|uniref:hypothetical protein n=1 Tax=Streptomyces goshikiensis TaxID=1942 RepID=UPI003646B4CF
MSEVQLGQRYVLAVEAGYGSGVGSVPQGAVAVPLEIVPPGTAGVGYTTEDVVVAAYEDSTTVPGYTVNRTLAISVSLFEASFVPEASLPPVPPVEEEPPPETPHSEVVPGGDA